MASGLLPQDPMDAYYIKDHPQHDARVREVTAAFARQYPPTAAESGGQPENWLTRWSRSERSTPKTFEELHAKAMAANRALKRRLENQAMIDKHWNEMWKRQEAERREEERLEAFNHDFPDVDPNNLLTAAAGSSLDSRVQQGIEDQAEDAISTGQPLRTGSTLATRQSLQFNENDNTKEPAREGAAEITPTDDTVEKEDN